MALLMDINEHDRQREDVIEDVLTLMWRSVDYYFAALMSAVRIDDYTTDFAVSLFKLLSHNLQAWLMIAFCD